MNAEAASTNPGDTPLGAVRVLWLSKGLGPGGAERVIALSARHRDRRRITGAVAYLLPHKTALVAEIEAEDVPVTCLGAPRAWDVRWLARLRRSLKAEPVDIVHSHSPIVAIGARLVVRTIPKASRPALVTTFHSLWDSKVALTRAADAATARLDDAQIAVSTAVLESMPAPIARSAEVVIHGVDTAEVLSAAPEREQVRAEMGWGDDQVVVLTVANLRRQKGYPDLFAAARSVADRRKDVRFAIVGQGQMEAEVAAMHASSGLGDQLQVLGYRSDAPRLMAGADIFCLASHAEGFPLALVEASMLGLPIVATRVGGIPEVVADGETGVLVPPASPQRLAAAIEALADDPERRTQLGAAGAVRVEAFSIEAAVARNEAIYHQLAGR